MEYGARILVIDDEAIVCRNCKRMLADEGYEVETTVSGLEALEILKREDFDIVLVDLKMPEIGGMELLEAVRESYPDIEVIIITGYSTVKSAVEAIKKGAFDYVPKPFTSGELLVTVEKALERRRLVLENRELRRELVSRTRYGNLIGESEAMQDLYRLIEEVTPTDSTVLIQGESGTGKELVARAIHYNGPRREGRFLPVDCAALSESLLESELFGHVRGSFTGAVVSKAGLFEIASGGTLFLDEIGNIALPIQAKLLRVLQERQIKPVGAVEPKGVDVRLIAATNKDLEAMIEEGSFREDLFYRINIFPIPVPPLRERKGDIPHLVYHFIGKYGRALGKTIAEVDTEVLRILQAYHWPGNVRELENAIHRMVVTVKGDVLLPEDLPQEILDRAVKRLEAIPRSAQQLKDAKKRARRRSVLEIEKSFLLDALERNDWNVSRAARDVGMRRSNFQALMKKHAIRSGKAGP
jgi:DNA-binding NtrC family response regulator